jgi:hypothetical protein
MFILHFNYATEPKFENANSATAANRRRDADAPTCCCSAVSHCLVICEYAMKSAHGVATTTACAPDSQGSHELSGAIDPAWLSSIVSSLGRYQNAVKINRPLLISIFLNLTLIGWIISLRVAHSRQITSAATTNATTKIRAPADQSKAAHDFPPQFVATHQASPFDWRQVESPDYKEYIANLRAIGCPEKTIKEIVTADVKDLFSARRAAITQTNHYEYWQATPVNLSEEQRKQLQELSIEQSEVLKALGIELSAADLFALHYGGVIATKRELELEFLSEPKRQSLNDLLFGMAQQRLAAGDDQRKLHDLEEQTQSAIKSLLTPDEFRDYELRTSFPALQLRAQLADMEPTEQEFRTIFDYWNALNAHQPGSTEYREAQQSSEDALRSLLGPSRFEIYLEGVKRLGYSK